MCRGVAVLLFVLPLTLVPAVQAADSCGERVSVQSHKGTTMHYSVAAPSGKSAKPAALVLLAGGSGYLDLDDKGCPRLLTGNSLVRSAAIFRELGFTTALVDAPSDYTGEDGLGGFRAAPAHAEDLGLVIAGLRKRTGGAVWVVGTSRGTISAANAAARLSGDSAPDGVVLTSVLTVGDTGQKRAWVAQTIYDVPLDSIRIPALMVGHEKDLCRRSPPTEMHKVADGIGSARKQVVVVTGGAGRESGAQPGLAACKGQSPHGFMGQEAEVAAGIARFVRGGSY